MRGVIQELLAAEEQARQLVSEARAEAARIVAGAQATARSEAERVAAEAKAQAEALLERASAAAQAEQRERIEAAEARARCRLPMDPEARLRWASWVVAQVEGGAG